MAVVQPILNTSSTKCPNIVLTDATDYTNGIEVVWNFQFHDYSGGNPTVNTTFTFSELNIGSDDLITTNIVIDTDGAGNIVNVEQQYEALISEINLSTNYQAILVKPPLTGFKQWYVKIGSFDLTKAGSALSVVVSPAGMTPVLTEISTGALVDNRNMVLCLPDGKLATFDAVAQVDTITYLAASYPEGETATLTFCSETLSYTPDIDTTGICIAEKLADLINTESDNLFFKYIVAESIGNELKLTAKIPGVPFQVVPSYALVGTYFIQANVVDNASNMELPSFTSENTLTYDPQEKGGSYKAVLTIVSGCDYNQTETVLFNWCYDIVQFSCCFLNLVKGSTCGCSNKNKCDSSIVYSIIKSVEMMIDAGFSEAEIQKVIDLGWSTCEPLSCASCNSCQGSGPSCPTQTLPCGTTNLSTNNNTGDCGC